MRLRGLLVLTVALSPLILHAKPTSKAAPPPTVIVSVPTPPPLYETYGDWVVQKINSAYSAGVVNPSGSWFGVVCGATCAVAFNPVVECKDGDQYPALINASDGAFSVTFKCAVVDKRWLLMANMDSTMVSSMEIGGQIGIAFPMKSGEFKVSRFSLTGSLKAATRAYSLSPAGQKDPTEKGLRDQTL